MRMIYLFKVIKENKDMVAFTFPTALKYANVKPVLKKDDKTEKENYRSISIIPTFSKVYKRRLYNQMDFYIEELFSKFQCGFQKGFNAQHCLITMIEKWQRSVDGAGQTGALLTVLAKAFDCVDHELLILNFMLTALIKIIFTLLIRI